MARALPVRRPVALAAALALAVAVAHAAGPGCFHLGAVPLPTEPNRGAPPAPDPHAAVARKHAPFIYHATCTVHGRQDVISNVDFDGDLVGANNWESFERFRLRPTVYYAVLETETHYFLAYHLFHPRDWNHVTFYVNATHEIDGENLQVVVRKADGRVVLLWTQAHYRGWVYTNPGTGIGPGEDLDIEGPLETVDDAGLPRDGAPHAAVFVQAEGHGIYGSRDSCSEVEVRPDGTYFFGGRGAAGVGGLLFRPARPGEAVDEPATIAAGEVAYELDSTTAKLWPLLRDGELTGDGRLLDGSWRYRDDQVDVAEVPRYYDGDRASGPFGPDRGIAPFAIDLEWEEGTLGGLFFNPARRYAETLTIEGPWSRRYVGYPFGPK